MPDAIFADRRLAEIYDALEGERHDLDAYAATFETHTTGRGASSCSSLAEPDRRSR